MGDYGFKVFTSKDPAELTNKLNAEIANSLWAMMAIIEMFFQDGLTGSAWGDWTLYTDSPLRALARERSSKVPRACFFGGSSGAPAYKVFDPASDPWVSPPTATRPPSSAAGAWR